MAPIWNVTIAEARGILAGDDNGLSDPYVKVLLLDAQDKPLSSAPQYKTSTVRKSISPKWQETFTFGEIVDIRLATTMRFIIMDDDGKLKKDDYLGVVDIPIDMLLSLNESLDHWYDIKQFHNMSTDAQGQLRIILYENDSTTNVESFPPNILLITLKSGRNLLPMDIGGASDPFVKFNLQKQSLQSTIKNSTLNPEWNESFAFQLLEIPTDTEGVEVIVEDKDLTVNDFLGQTIIPFTALKEHENVELDLTLMPGKKQKQDTKERGSIQLSALWTFREDVQGIIKEQARAKTPLTIFASFSTKSGQSGKLKQNIDGPEDGFELPNALKKKDSNFQPMDINDIRMTKEMAIVSIYRAKELPSMDLPSGLDAYVRVWINTTLDANLNLLQAQKEMASDQAEIGLTTRVIPTKGKDRKVLKPHFNELFALRVANKQESNLAIGVYDWDRVGHDEVVGIVTLPLPLESSNQEKQPLPYWVPIYGYKSLKYRANKKKHMRIPYYQGSLLMHMKLIKAVESESKRPIEKIPFEMYPTERLYCLRVHVVMASELVLAEKNVKEDLHVVVSCGLNTVVTEKSPPENGVVEWNQILESDRWLFPHDISQVPDIFVYICKGKASGGRKELFFARLKAQDVLLSRQQERENEVECYAVHKTEQKGEGPVGHLMMRIGLSPWEQAMELPWDHDKQLMVLGQRSPYQVRLSMYKAQLVSSGKPSWNIQVKCLSAPSFQMKPKSIKTSPDQASTDLLMFEETAIFDIDLPLNLEYAPPLSIYIREEVESSKQEEIERSAQLFLHSAPIRSAKDLESELKSEKSNGIQEPGPTWITLHSNSESASGKKEEILVAMELIKRSYPGEDLPEPPSITA